MGRKKTTMAPTPVVDDEAALDDVDLNVIEEEPALTEFMDVNVPETPDEPKTPTMSDPEWTTYVLSLLADNEKNKHGQPTTPGLRRIARLVIGPTLKSVAKVVQPAVYVPEAENLLQVATVEYEITFLSTMDMTPLGDCIEVTYRDCAECYAGQTELKYAKHPSATAATKAEGRCLRKALQLNGVICAEEGAPTNNIEGGEDQKIAPHQKHFIETLCERMNIDVSKYLAGGKEKYESLDSVNYKTAEKICEHLSEMQRNNKVPQKFLKDKE